ncbi:cation:proton antiporter [Streptomyces sp. NPDC088785]|uniref:cation:proton antiporter n=1 Tax=Streptomyces sp. NPDC088785 TaxID=3365897 RepID=UPI0037F9A8AB
MSQPGTLILIMAIAVLAPLLAYGVGRWLPVPLVIFEILLGILAGPDALGWASGSGAVVDTLSDLGLAMLIFLAGYEIDFDRIRGGTLQRSLWSWAVSLVVGLGLGVALAGWSYARGVYVGTALTSTALGTILPVLRDAGDLHSRFGSVLMAFGAVGEFGPIIAMALLLSGRSPLDSALLLLAFAALTALAVLWAMRPRPPWFSRVIAKTLHSSGQFAVRLVVLLLALMLGLSQVLGVDTLLGAFAAGMIVRLVLHGAAPDSADEVVGKVEAMGFGFLVPLFFVVTGIEFDLRALLDGGTALLLLPVFLVLFLCVRGLPVYFCAPADLTGRDRLALTFFSSTALPLVVAITTIGVQDGALPTDVAAALVGAAMVSVLVFPLIGLKLRAGAGERARPRGPVKGAESW